MGRRRREPHEPGISDEEVEELNRIFFGRWRSAIEEREPVAIGALYHLVEDIAKAKDPEVTPRQVELLQLAAEGKTMPEMADELFLSRETIKEHLERARFIMGAKNIAHAIAIAFRDELIK